MKQLHNMLVKLTLIAGSVVLVLAMVTAPLLAQGDPESPIPFMTDEVVTIEAVSEKVGEGEVSFSPGEEPDHIVIAIDGTVLQHDDPLGARQYACIACIETIHLAPDMQIPLYPFFVDEVLSELNPEIVQDGKVTTTVDFDAEYIKLDFEGVVLDFLTPVEDGDEVIASGPEGATLSKDGKGFQLVEGASEYLIAGEATESANESGMLIKLTEVADPDTPLQLDVITGKYQLVNGTTLQAGSSIRVHQDWMTFPPGLAIDIGAGGITLQGEDYAEGTRLRVDESGNLVESETSATAAGDEPGGNLPTYSEVVATYPPDADLCNTDATVVGESGGGWKMEGTVSIRNGQFTYHCYGAKITLAIDTTWDDGNDYPAGTLLTVDADLNWIPVSSWD